MISFASKSDSRSKSCATAGRSALTAIDDRSRPVQQQYEENPYPRWIVIPPVSVPAANPDTQRKNDILIVGCGTGQQSIDAALLFPHAHILAVDISLTSLAYARRKTREAGLKNIDYAHADILKLGTLDRRFDYIEAEAFCTTSPIRLLVGASYYRCCGQAARCALAFTAK